MFLILIKLDNKLRGKIKGNYIFGMKTQWSIHKIKNHSIWTCIHREPKEQSKKKKKIVHEEREKWQNL